ncbi:MAG: hypothetical protein K0R55_4551 [Sporomusa sp.]|nr:hypothetical protein [Sporomusa sp.]
MLDREIYDRIETICKLLENNDDLDEKTIEALYDELEARLNDIMTYRQKAG